MNDVKPKIKFEQTIEEVGLAAIKATQLLVETLLSYHKDKESEADVKVPVKMEMSNNEEVICLSDDEEDVMIVEEAPTVIDISSDLSDNDDQIVPDIDRKIVNKRERVIHHGRVEKSSVRSKANTTPKIPTKLLYQATLDGMWSVKSGENL